MDEGGGGAGSAQRAQVKELGELLKAFDERPGDPSLAAKLLAYPLERRAWEGLGEDVDAALVDMALLAGNAARAFGKREEAIGWYDAALEPCERAATASEEGSPERVEARARLVRTLVGMAANRWELSERNPRYLDEAVSYLERAMRIAEELVAEDAGHSGLLASCQCRLGHVYGDLKRPDDARPLFERAAEVLWPMIGTWETSSTLSGDPRLLLISALIGLDRTEEAHNVLERALLEGQQPGNEGRFDARSFAGFAFSWASQLVARNLHSEIAWWAERAASLFDSMPYCTPRDVESLAGANTLMGCCRFEAAEASAEAARARGEPAEIDPAEADRAIASCQRAVDLAASIEGRALDGLAIFASTATFIAKFYAMTGRPEQALEAYERADALMPRFGVTRETRPAVIAFEEGFHRSECLRSAGRDAEAVRWIEQALTAIDRVEEGAVVNKEGARAHLCAQLLAIAEQTGIEARLDAAGFVIGSARLARIHIVAGRSEEAARWIERSEAARKEASLPAPAHLDNLAETACYVGDSLRGQGRVEEANSFWSRAAAMFDEIERPDPSSRKRQVRALSCLGGSIISAAWPDVEAALGAEPPDIARLSDLMAEPIRLLQRSGEVLMTLIDELPDADGD
jgi:tetratricopeptide (TPR) repeat protein